MKHTLTILLLTGTFCVAQDSAGQVTSKPPEKLLGSWKQVPEPDDPSALRVEPEGSTVKPSFGCKPDGSCLDRNCDGNDHPDSTFGADAVYSCRFPDDRTYEVTSKRNGKVFSIITRRVSEDGKKMLATRRNADDKITSEYTYEKMP